MRTINNRTLVNIVLGWVATPVLAGIVAFVMMKGFAVLL
jgi:phosphate/sulfate permease